MIEISEIREGDAITISDGYNRAHGVLYRDSRLNLCVEAFGQPLIILKRSPGGRNTLVKPLKIIDHQPMLFA